MYPRSKESCESNEDSLIGIKGFIKVICKPITSSFLVQCAANTGIPFAACSVANRSRLGYGRGAEARSQLL